MDPLGGLPGILTIAEYAIISYVALIQTIYLLLMILGYFTLRQSSGSSSQAERDALIRSPLLPSVSVVAPAYNEAATIRESTRAMLGLRYATHEVIVVNDGSTDDTLATLIREFRLYRSSRTLADTLVTQPVRGVYESRDPIPLLVIDKVNGGKADSLNAGLMAARSSLVATVDADSLLEPDALVDAVRPFLEDFDRTLATGGIVRPANGCTVEDGRVTRVATPAELIPLFQVVEYLRAFLGGRVAFGFLNSLLVLSGAFAVFRRDVLVEVGGFLTSTVGEDMEIVVRLHKLWRRVGTDYRIVFVAHPVCWTEVPRALKALQTQRNRWQRGTAESLWRHREIALNPRFGTLGMFSFPYFAIFELLGPPIELAGYVLTTAGLALGFIAPAVGVLFFLVSVVFGMFLSLAAVLLESFVARRHPTPLDIMRLCAAGVLENLGFRQLTGLWRVQGTVDAIRRKRQWGEMERQGFAR